MLSDLLKDTQPVGPESGLEPSSSTSELCELSAMPHCSPTAWKAKHGAGRPTRGALNSQKLTKALSEALGCSPQPGER